MDRQTDIAQQKRLLDAHRTTLHFYLEQQALLGGRANISPQIAHGINEARVNIKRIKQILQAWKVEVDDLPDDEEAAIPEIIAPSAQLYDIPGTTAVPSSSSQRNLLLPPNLRLAAFGFRYNPFAYYEAEKMPSEALEETFVVHGGFDDDVLDFNHSAALLAQRGGGKTANRRRLEEYLSQTHTVRLRGSAEADQIFQHPFTVVYNNFTDVVAKLPKIHIDHYARSFLNAVAKAIKAFVVESPERFMALERVSRHWWWSLLDEYFEGVGIEFYIQNLHDCAQDFQLWKSSKQAAFRANTSFHAIVEFTQQQIFTLGFDSLFILVDELDSYHETSINMSDLVVPLLNALPLFSMTNVIWKFFLSDSLEEVIVGSEGHRTKRIRLVKIHWDEDSLIALLQNRLKWASDGAIQDIRQLCNQELLGVVDVEREIAQMALRHRTLGPPRALLYLGERLLKDEAL